MDGSAVIFLRIILGPRLLDIWTFGCTCFLAPSFHISGFLTSLLLASAWRICSYFVLRFDSGFGVVLELNNTLQLFG